VSAAVARAESRILDPLPAGKRADFMKMLALIASAASDGESDDMPKPAARRKAGGRRPRA
jgi:hypothetical protein